MHALYACVTAVLILRGPNVSVVVDAVCMVAGYRYHVCHVVTKMLRDCKKIAPPSDAVPLGLVFE